MQGNFFEGLLLCDLTVGVHGLFSTFVDLPLEKDIGPARLSYVV